VPEKKRTAGKAQNAGNRLTLKNKKMVLVDKNDRQLYCRVVVNLFMQHGSVV
jgi:hypothetical protein